MKLNTGSSATGIVVLHPNRGGRAAFGITTLAEIGGAFYNSRLVRRVTGADLDSAVQFILDEGAIVQRGIPMAQADGQNFDVRVVTVYGKPAAMIFRLSPHPMTNLHLGGHRGDYDRCRAAIPTRDWLDALDHCSDAAACFDSAIAGVDLLFERGYRRHYILEVNAFGDFFPGWTDARRRSVHASSRSPPPCRTIRVTRGAGTAAQEYRTWCAIAKTSRLTATTAYKTSQNVTRSSSVVFCTGRTTRPPVRPAWQSEAGRNRCGSGTVARELRRGQAQCRVDRLPRVSGRSAAPDAQLRPQLKARRDQEPPFVLEFLVFGFQPGKAQSSGVFLTSSVRAGGYVRGSMRTAPELPSAILGEVIGLTSIQNHLFFGPLWQGQRTL